MRGARVDSLKVMSRTIGVCHRNTHTESNCPHQPIAITSVATPVSWRPDPHDREELQKDFPARFWRRAEESDPTPKSAHRGTRSGSLTTTSSSLIRPMVRVLGRPS